MTAAHFAAALEALDWTQAQAAAELGICSRQRVSDYARGTRAVPRYISAALRYRLDDCDTPIRFQDLLNAPRPAPA